MKPTKIIWIIMFWSIAGTLYSQTGLIKVTKKDRAKSIREVFYVLSKNNSIKQGDYTRYLNRRMIESGKFTDNRRSGVWIFYEYDNSVYLKYDYDNDSVLFFTPKGDISGLDRPPIYLGSPYEARSIVVKNLQYPLFAAENGISGKVLVDIFIDKYGKVYDYKVQKSIYPLLDYEALRVVGMIPQTWLPAIKNGKPIASKSTFPVNFTLN